MTSNTLEKINLDMKNDLKLGKVLVLEQRENHEKSIKKLHQEHKKHLHISEYKLIVGLFKGLENSLLLEYLYYLENDTSSNYLLFDVWGMDKLVRIYSNIK